MEFIVSIILQSGKSALDMVIYLLVPVMVVMLAFMKLLEQKGILAWVSNMLARVSSIFGIPGLGVFAMVKMMFVSFAAPIATLSMMNRDATHTRQIAATVAGLLVMSQANVVYPLAVVGLNVQVIYLTSIIGALLAAMVTYYLVLPARSFDEVGKETKVIPPLNKNMSVIQILSEGGKDGLIMVFNMIPLLILSLCVVNLMDYFGLIELLGTLLTPILNSLGLPDQVVLPMVTKFIAGGTAFVGVTLELMNQGLLTANDLNRMAGIVINPFDLVALSLFVTAGVRIQQIIKPAIIGACVGVVARAAMHLIIF